MTGQAKVRLILELKNRMNTGLSKAKKSVNQNVLAMKSKLSDLKNHHIKAFTAMRNEIPMLDKAFRLLGNPYVLMTAGAISLAVVIGKTTKKAAEFEHAFLPIKQLNLDKSAGEMQKYQKQIKNAAFDIGTDLKDSTQAFYDLQSGTGLFGKEAVGVFKKVGKYSIITGANINDSTNSVVKAMKAFGLGTGDIDSLLASNAKTVQQGIVSFDELAKVQTEYAGAAANAGQSVDTANKLFSAFTSIAKDAREGATLTKTAFQGLTQASTIKGIEGLLGKDKMYDATGNMRDMGNILKDVSAKFKTMSSKDIDVFINKVGGPEGLRAMFGKLKTGADDFFNTMDKFDKTEFNFAKAFKNAKGDAATIANIAKHRLGTIMVQIGQHFLPIWVMVLEKVNKVLKFVWNNFDTIWTVVKNVGIGLVALKVGMIAFNIITMANPIGAIVAGVIALIAGITILIKKTTGWGNSWFAIKTIASIFWKEIKLSASLFFDSVIDGVKIIWLKLKSLGQWIGGFFSNIGKAISLAWHGDFHGAKLAMKSKIEVGASAEIEEIKAEQQRRNLSALNQIKADKNNIIAVSKMLGLKWDKKTEKEKKDGISETGDGKNPFSTTTDNTQNSTITPGNNSINKITGSAKQIRNIMVNIDSFNKGGINTENTQLQQMDGEQIEAWFNNMMLRVVRNVELSY